MAATACRKHNFILQYQRIYMVRIFAITIEYVHETLPQQSCKIHTYISLVFEFKFNFELEFEERINFHISFLIVH